MTRGPWVWLALALAGAGCGGSSPGASTDPSCGQVPEQGPNASSSASAADARTVLAANCALGGCHASAPGAGGLVLAVRSSSWPDALVGVPSQENPSMDLVAANDPQGSWLVHKIYGAVCGFGCDPTLGCGGQMPFGGSLDAADRATLVAWIEGGAPRE